MSKKLTFDELNKRLKENTTLELLEINDDKYKVKCSVCNQTYETYRVAIKRSFQCLVCNNKIIINGYNDIYTTSNWMVEYLKDEEDAFKYMSNSNKRISFKCPNCGYEKISTPNIIFRNGFSCKMCGDKISRPNKFIREVLKRLPLKNLDFEYVSEWTNGKRYDAYFEYKDERYVLEIDGGQHFKDSVFGTYEEQIMNDEYKNTLAEQNNINMIRIKFPLYNDYNIPIKDFEDSILGELIQKYEIDWNDCILKSQKSILVEICDFYNNKTKIIKEISKEFDLATNTIQRYLSIGKKIGICDYNVEISKNNSKKNVMRHVEELRKKIVVEDIITGSKIIYESKESCSKALNIAASNLPSYCRNEIIKNNLKFSYYGEIPFKERALKNPKFYTVCEYGNKHIDGKITDFSKELHISAPTITSYLKLGIEMGICNYSFELADKRRTLKMVKTKQKNKMV